MSISKDLQKLAGNKPIEPVTFQIHPKEQFYFTVMAFISIVVYVFIFLGLYEAFLTGMGESGKILLIYFIIFILYIVISLGVFVGYLKGNAIKITPHQFPDIYQIASRQSVALGLSQIPDIYLLQAGGLLNAFATKFLGRNYVVLFSDILEEAYDNNVESVEFIIAHELGHVKRNHISKRLFLFPSFLIPFLFAAYSRACEYTCDGIGAALSPKGAQTGLLLLAAGKKLHTKVNLEKFVEQDKSESGFWYWFAEKFSTHPNLTKRIQAFTQVQSSVTSPQQSPAYSPDTNTVTKPEIQEEKPADVVEEKSEDHSKYMP